MSNEVLLLKFLSYNVLIFHYIIGCEQAHDGGVVAVELSRVMGSAPQLITIGADKTLAIWDTMTFKVYSQKLSNIFRASLMILNCNFDVC